MAGGIVTLANDRSFKTILSSETKPTDLPNGTPLLEVDTATWYVFYNGTWYAQ